MADRAAVRRAARWALPAVLVLAVVAWFAVRAGTATGAETDRYATTTVTTGSVTQTYAGSGTVTQVQEATATFPASATVTKVDVAVGDEVEAGDVLASIDDSALETAELEAEQTLADAQVALEGAQDAADASASATASPTASASASRSSSGTPTRSTTSTSTPSPTTPATSGTGDAGSPAGGAGGTGGGGSGSLPAASLPTLATNVVQAQAALTHVEHTAALQLAAQQKVCTPLSVTPSPSGSASASGSTIPSSSATETSSASPTGSATPTGSAAPSGTATPTTSGTPTTTPTATTPTASTTSATPAQTLTPSPVASVDATTLARCIAAVVALQQTQQADAAQRTTYDAAVNALVTAASGTSQGSTPSSGSGSDGSGSSGGAGSGGGAASGSGVGSGSESEAGTGSSPSSGSDAQSSTAGSSRTGQTTTVASAEAAVTKAQLALDSAQAQLEAATMTAPISGTVAAVPFAKGDTAGTSDAVTIVGAGAVSVQMAVPEAAFRLLKVGQAVTLTTPGGGTATGEVTQRGLLPDASSTTTTYPVTVTASGRAARTLPTGATASLAVTVARATGATVLPVSALTRSGSTGTVQVLADGSVSRQQVTLGVVGTSTVQVTDGLVPGQVLVLADKTAPLPTTSANQGTRALAGGGAGGPGAGGAPPGGR